MSKLSNELKNELKDEFFEVLEEHQKCYEEVKKLKINTYFCGNRNSLINDFMYFYEDDDIKMLNKIIGSMQCDIKLYKLIKTTNNKEENK